MPLPVRLLGNGLSPCEEQRFTRDDASNQVWAALSFGIRHKLNAAAVIRNSQSTLSSLGAQVRLHLPP